LGLTPIHGAQPNWNTAAMRHQEEVTQQEMNSPGASTWSSHGPTPHPIGTSTPSPTSRYSPCQWIVATQAAVASLEATGANALQINYAKALVAKAVVQ
jgi:hypothetical protein